MAPPGLGRWSFMLAISTHFQEPRGSLAGAQEGAVPFEGSGTGSVHPRHLGRPLFPSGLHILALKRSYTVKCLIALTRGVPHKGSGRFRVTGEETISHMAQIHVPCPCLELSSCSREQEGTQCSSFPQARRQRQRQRETRLAVWVTPELRAFSLHSPVTWGYTWTWKVVIIVKTVFMSTLWQGSRGGAQWQGVYLVKSWPWV